MSSDLQRIAVKSACALIGGVAGFGLGMLAGPLIVSGMGAVAGYRAGDYVNDAINLKKEESDEATL